MLTLDPFTPEVCALTATALRESRGRSPSLTIRCRARSCVLAVVGYTPTGPLFTSSWHVAPAPHQRVSVNGDELRPRELRMWNRGRLDSESGHPVDEPGRDGVVALLTVPAGVPEDYPPLLVRCEHGDAVLDRLEVVEWLRTPGRRKVTVSKPFHAYQPRTILAGHERHSTATYLVESGAATLEDLDALLGWG